MENNLLDTLFGGMQRKKMCKNISSVLKISPSAYAEFEKAYEEASLAEPKDNFFSINSKEASKMVSTKPVEEYDKKKLEDIKSRIVEELLSVAFPGTYIGTPGFQPVTKEEILEIPESIRPQLTGRYALRDIEQPSCEVLLWHYSQYLKTGNKIYYHQFRQGLDILDLDDITYEIIGMNLNSIGYWFPEINKAALMHGFFKIPETKIIKVPLTILQLTRIDYMQLTKTTLDIIDRFCMKAFELDPLKKYFIKTGTYSSKFDFRNASISDEDEVKQIGEYLLFIHFQALQMASSLNTDASGRPRSIYGVSTTNEWCVREYIQDKENNPCIYHGMPLHTEYRVFVDFDKDKVLAVAPYWDPETMKKRFSEGDDADTADMKHDYIIYLAHEDVLMKRFNENKDLVYKKIEELLPDVEIPGQWSIDVMQNGDDFWIIDMARAETSALKEYVPAGLLNHEKENWIPNFT